LLLAVLGQTPAKVVRIARYALNNRTGMFRVRQRAWKNRVVHRMAKTVPANLRPAGNRMNSMALFAL
jgi:hypothetical protein